MWNSKKIKIHGVFILLLMMTAPHMLCAQTMSDSICGHYVHKEYDVHFYFDLNGKGVEVPGYTFLGKMKGYIDGQINGKWFLTTAKEDAGGIVMRFANDQGSDTQVMRAIIENDSTITMRLEGQTYIRRIEKRKYVKFPHVLQITKCER